MKRLSCLLILMCLVFTLCACEDDPVADDNLGSPDGFWGDNGDTTPDSADTPVTPDAGSPDSPDEPTPSDSPSGGDNWLMPDDTPAEPEPVDPNSNILPDLGSFLMLSPSTHKDFGDNGRQMQWNGSHPFELCESTRSELMNLLLEPQYQLSLRESKQNPHYANAVEDIFFDYTGTNAEVTALADERGENTFHVRLRISSYEDYKHFKITLVYSSGFTLTEPEGHVSRDITPGGDMRWLTPRDESAPPESTDSVLFPCLDEFLYREPNITANHSAYGDPYGRADTYQNLPLAAYDTVKAEVLELLTQPLYQLRQTDHKENAHYDLTGYDYYFEYVGTNEDVTPIIDKFEQKYSFDVMVRFVPDVEVGIFQIFLFYSPDFEPVVTASHTTRDVSRGGDGSVLPEDHQKPDGEKDDFFAKCSSCHGSGKCTHCGGDGEVKKFQAGLGWVELDCTLCNRGKCRHCGGDGKK